MYKLRINTKPSTCFSYKSSSLASPQYIIPLHQPRKYNVHNTFLHRTHQYTAHILDTTASKTSTFDVCIHIQRIPLATEMAGWLAGWPLLRVARIRRTTDTFLFIPHTTNVLLFKFRCNIFIGVRIIKEMLGSVASATRCISTQCKQ